MEPSPHLLKHSPARQVLVVEGRVQKRFRHPGWIARLWDRSRARREFTTLRRLAEAGIPVPHPRTVARGPGGWTVEMDWLREARPLAAWLDEPAWPFDAARLARELGRLLARVHRLGLDHPDLHAGNVLVEPDGAVWAVDFHKAELRRPDPEVWTRDLVALGSSVRERTSARFRARAYWAWRRELGRGGDSLEGVLGPQGVPGPPEGVPGPNGHAREIELGARRHRFEVVRERRLRWTRESSSCRVLRRRSGTAFARSELSDADVARLESRARPTQSGELVRTGTLELVCVTGARAEVLDVWYGAARLEEHGLGVRPHVFFDAREPRAFVQVHSKNVDGEESTGLFLEKLADRGIRVRDIDPSSVMRERGLLRDSVLHAE